MMYGSKKLVTSVFTSRPRMMSDLVARPVYKAHYDNFIGGAFVPPVGGKYFDNISPIDGKPYTKAAQSGAADVELALDAAHKAAVAYGKTSATFRSNMLNKIADRIEANLEALAVAETIDNGKPIRETRAADLPLVVSGKKRRGKDIKDSCQEHAFYFAHLWIRSLFFVRLTTSATSPAASAPRKAPSRSTTRTRCRSASTSLLASWGR